MLKKLQLKFVCITMAIVTVMLCVILGMVLHFTARNLEEQSLHMLQRLSTEPMQPGRPGAPQNEVRLPYLFLHIGHSGDIMAKAGGYFDVSDESFLTELINKVRTSQEKTGVLSEYALRYYCNPTPHGESMVFADISSEQQLMRSMWVTCLLIGAACLAAFFGISFLVARWTVKPVEKAWTEQRQFVADASHELKTPLTVIMTNGELLSTLSADDAKRDQCVSSINTTARQMRGLVEDLLELARVDNGLRQEVYGTVDLSETVNETVLPFEAMFFEAGTELLCRIQPDIRVKGSQSHLYQVVEILLDNAGKYSKPETQVQLLLEKVGSRDCLLTVTNRADPIPREELENIFQRFYRVDKARSEKQSYGLGLAIARGIVEAHRGRIWAESGADSVSFHVQLPLAAIKK